MKWFFCFVADVWWSWWLCCYATLVCRNSAVRIDLGAVAECPVCGNWMFWVQGFGDFMVRWSVVGVFFVHYRFWMLLFGVTAGVWQFVLVELFGFAGVGLIVYVQLFLNFIYSAICWYFFEVAGFKRGEIGGGWQEVSYTYLILYCTWVEYGFWQVDWDGFMWWIWLMNKRRNVVDVYRILGRLSNWILLVSDYLLCVSVLLWHILLLARSFD